MIALLQRVSEAQVSIGGVRVAAIGAGALVFVCAEPGDTAQHADRLVAKLLGLRIFSDDAGKMNRSLADTGGGLLLVPQFTLAADTSRGNRPGFSALPGRTLGAGSSTRCSRSRKAAMPAWPPACLAPTCKCIW